MPWTGFRSEYVRHCGWTFVKNRTSSPWNAFSWTSREPPNWPPASFRLTLEPGTTRSGGIRSAPGNFDESACVW